LQSWQRRLDNSQQSEQGRASSFVDWISGSAKSCGRRANVWLRMTLKVCLMFIQNATAAWRRSRRNGLNKTTKVVYTERESGTWL